MPGVVYRKSSPKSKYPGILNSCLQKIRDPNANVIEAAKDETRIYILNQDQVYS